jgi:FkbM family methyltransferase
MLMYAHAGRLNWYDDGNLMTSEEKKKRQAEKKQRERNKRKKERQARIDATIRRFCTSFGLKIPQRLLTKDEAFVREAAKGLTRNDIVIDLGSHVGMAATQFSHTAGKVYAFEPHPQIFKELEAAARRYRRIVPINAAASTADGTASLFSDKDPRPWKHTEGSTLVEGKSNLTYRESYDVKTVDLARFIKELGQPVRMIKMDVEGYEYRLINHLLDADVMAQVKMIHVEDHCDRVQNLAEERDRTLARINAAGLSDKFDFEWP